VIVSQVMRADNAAAYLSLISAMITPVFLIVASGTLVNATLSRMTRVTDRARTLIDLIADDHEKNDHEQEAVHGKWLSSYNDRSWWVQRALVALYCAISLFIASSLAIAFDRLTHEMAPWLAVVLVLGGATSLFLGTMCLLAETTLASTTLRDEIAHARDRIAHPVSGAASTDRLTVSASSTATEGSA
jgi:hypothetical protein